MFIHKLKLQNYRCFSDKTFLFEKQLVLLEGGNGTGKTSILEALHYGCFLKSFRTSRTKDLISFDKEHFFLHVDFEETDGDHNQVQVGVSFENGTQKKLARFNQNEIKSYKELISRYRIVSLAEEDLQLVQGAPEYRRTFLTQLLVLFEPETTSTFKKYRHILEHRNSVLANMAARKRSNNEELAVWTNQLLEVSEEIRTKYLIYLKSLEERVNDLFIEYFSTLESSISFDYVMKKADEFNEIKWGRSLFGIHLDDFSTIYQKKHARYFASRGQQKLVVFLIKIALAKELERKNLSATLLLDDFLTDFDEKRLSECLNLLSSMSCQTFITCPLKDLILNHYKNQPKELQIISI